MFSNQGGFFPPGGPGGPGLAGIPIEYLTARDLTMDSFPQYKDLPPHYSSGTGMHRIDFVGNLLHWRDFQSSVREFFDSTRWDDHPQPLSVRFAVDIGPNTLDKEHYICGAEISTSARYAQHVLHVMTAVIHELGYRLAFGDWGATQCRVTLLGEAEDAAEAAETVPDPGTSGTKKKEWSGIPDYAVIDVATGDARAIGEAKHPWGADLTRYMDQFLEGNPSFMQRFLGEFVRSQLHKLITEDYAQAR